MTNTEILQTLQRHEIKTVGDLDHYADIRGLSRYHALSQLVGQDAADLVLASLAVRVAQQATSERRAA